MTTLEARINRAAMSVRTIERAVHEPTGWTLRWGPHVIEAKVETTETGVQIVADFPEMCYLSPVDDVMTLWHGDTMLGVRPIPFPGDTSFVARWNIGVELSAEPV